MQKIKGKTAYTFVHSDTSFFFGRNENLMQSVKRKKLSCNSYVGVSKFIFFYVGHRTQNMSQYFFFQNSCAIMKRLDVHAIFKNYFDILTWFQTISK
jgi:hypothetical protein